MKACPVCGLEAEPAATECSGCQYKFTSAVADADTDTGAASSRPTGEGPTTAGWFCFCGAVLLFIFSLGTPTETYNLSLAEAYARQWIFQMGAAGAFSLAILLWCVGYIVKAISFLPGRGES